MNKYSKHMKITLSKKQWQLIGSKTGWLKLAAVVEYNKGGDVRTISNNANPLLNRREFRCSKCRNWIKEDNIVWIDPATGAATTGDAGRPYHMECAPGE